MPDIKLKTPACKRFLDILVSLVALVILSPVFLLISVLIIFTSGPPVLFRQQRPGKGGKPFMLYKFRSMQKTDSSQTSPDSDKDRITKVGRFLRRSSLDELPELINILKGEMSLVGPRPLLMQYLERYSPEQARRHQVLPGLTGWAQINGRNAISWEEKFRYDVWYVDNWSFWLDIRIIIITLWKAIRGEGISQEGHATMEEFKGSPKA